MKKEASNNYVYAFSNDGFWDNGNNLILGRVARNRIGNLNAADWQFYKGGDGMLDANWISDMNNGYSWANDDAAGMQYSAGWTDDNNRPREYNGDLHYTSGNGNYVQYTFTGTGVDWINEKASDLGNVDVYIDGIFDRTVSINSAARVH